MVSLRKTKKRAAALGLSEREFRLVELLDEMLEAMRWLQVLGWSNQFLLQDKLGVDAEERDRVVAAAARAVEADQKLHEWRARLAAIRGEIVRIERVREAQGGA